MEDTYLSIKAPAESLHKVKGSKHFGFIFPVRTEEDIKEKLEEIRKLHHSARHHSYAWRLGLDMEQYRANDDGEPSNSAGMPILGQIQSYKLSNVLIIVVRYFGGTKLGVGGLISAYRTAAKEAIENGTIIKRVVKNYFRLQFKYGQMSEVMGLIKTKELKNFDQDFALDCRITIAVRLRDSESVMEEFEKIEDIKITGISRK